MVKPHGDAQQKRVAIAHVDLAGPFEASEPEGHRYMVIVAVRRSQIAVVDSSDGSDSNDKSHNSSNNNSSDEDILESIDDSIQSEISYLERESIESEERWL